MRAFSFSRWFVARRPLIASSANGRLKAVRRLARRGSHELCLAEGQRAVRAALAAAAVRELYVAPALLRSAADLELVAAAEQAGADVCELAVEAFASLTPARPDGLLAVAARPATELARLALPPGALALVACGIERPGNLGTIVRTASALGADALLVADPRTDLFHRDVVRGSVGTVFLLPCATAATGDAIAWVRAHELRLVATSPAAPTPFWCADYGTAAAVAVGNERTGLARAWLAAADELVSIPLPGPADSLNVAVAAGVVLCEATRRRADGQRTSR